MEHLYRNYVKDESLLVSNWPFRDKEGHYCDEATIHKEFDELMEEHRQKSRNNKFKNNNY